MNQEVKKMWVEALRSGEYKQGKGLLRKVAIVEGEPDSFCCLGVLCDLHSKFSESKGKWHRGVYLEQVAHLPSEVQFWAELESDSPSLPDYVEVECYRGEDGRRFLTNINDRGGSFEEIATLIETHL